MIACRLSRMKIDANREIHEATGDNPLAIISFNDYHSFVDTAVALVAQMHGKGILIDVHAHGHTKQRLELGYLLSASQLASSDSMLNRASVMSQSSIRSLAQTGKRSFAELIRGETSIGSFFEYHGYPAIPSSMQFNPGSDLYFTGGYITEVHGSLNRGTVDAVQIETNSSGVRDTEANRRTFGKTAAEILDNYLNLHYFNAPVTTAKLALNEILFDIPPDDAGTTAIEGDVNGDGVRSVRADEFVEVANVGTQDANVGGFQILELNGRTIFSFPQNTVLKPKELAVVFGGIGPAGFGSQFSSPMKVFAASYGFSDSGFYYSSSKTNFLGAGDGVILIDPASNTVFDEVLWGSAVARTTKGKKLLAPNTVLGDSIAGAIRQSVTRSPDFTGLWTQHTQAYGPVHSPGRTGSPSTGIASLAGRPEGFRLLQNYPNPFNPTTAIGYQLSDVSFVTLRVFDILGREVATLVNEVRSPGTHVVRWDASGQASGFYLYRLSVVPSARRDLVPTEGRNGQARVVLGGQSRVLIATKKMLVVQ
jgi:hypothetical protein